MKKLFLVVISSILFAFNANAADMRIALVVKGLGIGFLKLLLKVAKRLHLKLVV
tara:strand:- start:107 stop:268 length:162 start_codon:yes stop_codon:yes gene_type:complete